MKSDFNAMTLERRRNLRLNLMVKYVLGMCLLVLSFFMVYHNVYDAQYSDVRSHIIFAMNLNRKNILWQYLTGNDKLWHTLLRIVYKLPGLSKKESACIVTSMVYTSYYFIGCAIMERELDLPGGVGPAGCFAVSIVSSIWAPWYSSKIYLTSGSPNPWHSPTQIMVKPFALLVFTMTAAIYNRLRTADGGWSSTAYKSKREAAVYTLLITFSVWAKPSFYQVIVPGLGILMVIDLVRSRGKSFLFDLKMVGAFVPGAALTVMMFVSSFFGEGKGEGGGIQIAPFAVWGNYSPNIPFSLLLLLAFPLFVYIMDRRSYLKTSEYPLTVTLLLSGATMRALLAEKGHRMMHGNFSWGFGLAVTLTWYVAMKRFCRLMTGDELDEREYRIAAVGGYSLLTLHLLSGIIYIYRIASSVAQC